MGACKLSRLKGGRRGGSHLYRMMRDGDVGPCLCGVPSQFIRDGRSAGAGRFRVLRGLRGLFSVGSGLSLPPPLRARARMGDRPPRSAFDSQLTLGACREQS